MTESGFTTNEPTAISTYGRKTRTTKSSIKGSFTGSWTDFPSYKNTHIKNAYLIIKKGLIKPLLLYIRS